MSTYKRLNRHLISYEIKCHFFITITNKVRSNKMIEMRSRNFIIKVFVFILSNLLSGGRHSVTTVPNKHYTINRS